MRAGLLRHRLAIQAATEAAATDGEPVATWATVVTVAADIVPFGGGESFTAKEVYGTRLHRISIRYRSDVTVKHRGLGLTAPYVDTVFDFQSVQHIDGRLRELEIIALERDT